MAAVPCGSCGRCFLDRPLTRILPLFARKKQLQITGKRQSGCAAALLGLNNETCAALDEVGYRFRIVKDEIRQVFAFDRGGGGGRGGGGSGGRGRRPSL